MMGYADIGGLR